MDQCSRHDIPPAVNGNLTDQQGHDLAPELKALVKASAHLLAAQPNQPRPPRSSGGRSPLGGIEPPTSASPVLVSSPVDVALTCGFVVPNLYWWLRVPHTCQIFRRNPGRDHCRFRLCVFARRQLGTTWRRWSSVTSMGPSFRPVVDHPRIRALH
jgi:hypothetical protein